MTPRRSQAEAISTHEAIVREAAEGASEIGLEGISIGSLAASLGMSKAGVAGHFRSKQDLQLEVIEFGAGEFTRMVWEPNASLKPGRERLLGCLDSWYAYSASGPFRGGCLLTAASTEFDGRPGVVRDAIVTAWGRWTRILERDLERAIEAGELSPPLSAADTVAAIESLAAGVNQRTQLFGSGHPERTAGAAARVLLGIGT